MIGIDMTKDWGIGLGSLELSTESMEDLCYRSAAPLEFVSQTACTSIQIMGEKGEVGCLDWDAGRLTFGGDMAESAHIFFEDFLKPMVDAYIAEMLGEA